MIPSPAFFSLVAAAIFCAHTAKDDPIPLSPEGGGGRSVSLTALKEGDIIISTTPAKVSGIIRGFSDSEISHAMVWVGRRDEDSPSGYVIEAVSSGVRKTDLESAISEASLAVALRHPEFAHISEEERLIRTSMLVSFLEQQIGKQYDFAGAFDQMLCMNGTQLCRISLPTGSKASDKWYCSGLVLAAFESVEAPLTERDVLELLKDVERSDRTPRRMEQLGRSNDLNYVGHIKWTGNR